ncbi:RcpC/CpaB family pilus assembly protein [Streptomyces griseoaurantiacus]|uniref:RcpC/CpaB family pilus assembly protein n=1 Tax=Streptomyces griseoaurantiacus TaxID=68213 RepID=UPI0037F13946
MRIADAATVGLLRPGDRVDVIAADGGGAARVVAAGARVVEVPGAPGGRGTDGTGTGTRTGTRTGSGTGTDTVAEAAPNAGTGPGTGAEPGALVVLSVPRAEAARLAGAGAAGRLAVTLR